MLKIAFTHPTAPAFFFLLLRCVRPHLQTARLVRAVLFFAQHRTPPHHQRHRHRPPPPLLPHSPKLSSLPRSRIFGRLYSTSSTRLHTSCTPIASSTCFYYDRQSVCAQTTHPLSLPPARPTIYCKCLAAELYFAPFLHHLMCVRVRTTSPGCAG